MSWAKDMATEDRATCYRALYYLLTDGWSRYEAKIRHGSASQEQTTKEEAQTAGRRTVTSAAERRLIRELVRSGMSMLQVARIANRSHSTVKSIMKERK